MIFKNRSDLMRYAQQQAGHGYYFFDMGSAPLERKKAQAMALKFEDRYGTNLPRWTRARLKKNGEANSVLLMLPYMATESAEKRIFWLLMATEGEGLVHQLEKLHDIRNKKHRLVIGEYELVKTARKKNPKYPDKSAAPAWTWRYTNEAFEDLKSSILAGTRSKNPVQLNSTIDYLLKTLGFHDSRQQAFELYELAKNDWARSKAESWPFDEDPKLPFFGRFKAPRLMTWADLYKEPTWKKTAKRNPEPK